MLQFRGVVSVQIVAAGAPVEMRAFRIDAIGRVRTQRVRSSETHTLSGLQNVRRTLLAGQGFGDKGDPFALFVDTLSEWIEVFDGKVDGLTYCRRPFRVRVDKRNS